MKRSYSYYICTGWLSLLLLGGCIEPYDLPESVENLDLLVVDSQLILEEGGGTVRLIRAQKLAETKQPRAETGAQVVVETAEGNAYPLTDSGKGLYTLSSLPQVYGHSYRIRIKTRNGREYLSDLVSTRQTPPIDSINWHVERDGVLVKVNTHDPQNNTRYYRWIYEETYAYNSGAASGFVYQNGEIVPRSDNIYNCWKTDPSHPILIGSTTRLSQDVVSDFPLVFHLGRARQMAINYSILVKQFALSREEFEYWQMLKKNTESVGTLFDAQPSQVTGNIQCLNAPEEPVIGFFSIYSAQQKRKGISAQDLGPYKFRYPLPQCLLDSIPVFEMDRYVQNSIIIYPEVNIMGVPIAWYVTTPGCADCRMQGGTTLRPDFM
jgi:hypothetical protein